MSSFFGWFSLNKDSSVEILRKTPQYTPIEIVKTGTHHKEILCNEKFNFERAIAKVFHGKAGKKEYTKELELLTNLQHKNIINFLSQSTVDGYHILVFRNLMKISERIEMRILFPPGSVQSLFKDLLTGLQFLHGKKYCHRLIMPENLLYTGNGVLKITGLSNVSPIKDSKNREILLNGLIGEGMYSAPECFSEVSYSGTEADIYSAGLILYAMIVLYNPYCHNRYASMLRRNSSAPPVTRRPSMNSDSSSTTIIKFPFLGKVEIRKTAMVTPLSPSRTSNLERTASRSVKYQVAPPERKRAQSVSRLTTTEKTATPVTTPKQIHGSLNNLKDENLYKYYPDPPQKDHYMKNTQCPDWVLVQKTIPVGLVSTRLKDGVHVVDEFRLHMKLSELQHPNILKMFSMKTKEFFHELRMEYVDGGSLKDQLCKNAFFTEPHAREIFTQLVDAVAFLHRRNIAHFDIHPGNIFVTQTGIVKVGGFWRAQMCFDKFGKIPQTYDGVRGHKAYAAPECFRKRKTARYLAPPVDNWACGIVLLTMLNNLPWLKAEKSHLQYADWVYTKKIPIPRYACISSTAKEIIEKLLDPNPKSRSTVETVKINNGWFPRKANAKNPSSAIRRVASNPNWKQ
ncbi:hypothetical protein L5515_019498 [Caenorhabditis briggsae]|uniref:Protein kinase domain-containing protein n=1 Tax=Caenorhabditis briggsae TaxID=6238 RepID=A0AAE9FJI6_CAEBR|nr:hypothetical protein L5515_019498 [Caenorhabditis briggsae]